MPVLSSAMPSCRHLHLRSPSSGYRRTGAAGPRADLEVCQSNNPLYRQSEIYSRQGVGAEPFTAVGLGGCMLPAAVSAGKRRFGYVMTDGKLMPIPLVRTDAG